MSQPSALNIIRTPSQSPIRIESQTRVGILEEIAEVAEEHEHKRDTHTTESKPTLMTEEHRLSEQYKLLSS